MSEAKFNEPSELREEIDKLEGAVVFDGMDDAIIGFAAFDMNLGDRLVYSVDRILDILISQGMTADEAQEYFDYNIGCLIAGKQTPILMHTFRVHENPREFT